MVDFDPFANTEKTPRMRDSAKGRSICNANQLYYLVDLELKGNVL